MKTRFSLLLFFFFSQSWTHNDLYRWASWYDANVWMCGVLCTPRSAIKLCLGHSLVARPKPTPTRILTSPLDSWSEGTFRQFQIVFNPLFLLESMFSTRIHHMFRQRPSDLYQSKKTQDWQACLPWVTVQTLSWCRTASRDHYSGLCCNKHSETATYMGMLCCLSCRFQTKLGISRERGLIDCATLSAGWTNYDLGLIRERSLWRKNWRNNINGVNVELKRFDFQHHENWSELTFAL